MTQFANGVFLGGSRLLLAVAAVWCVGGTVVGAQAEVARFDTIAGPLPRIVKNTGKPYFVDADIEVPVGHMVTIEPGVVFLFKNFTGLHVQGRLVAEGTRAEPIVFTSVLDREFNPASSLYPNPYDWNGVYLHADALGSTMAFIKVSYSVYGVISETKFIRIKSGEFKDNGKSDLEIEKVKQVVTTEPYDYVLSTKDATVDGIPVRLLRDPMAPKRTVFRTAGVVAFVGGGALGIYEAFRLKSALSDLDALSSTETDNLRNNSSSDWENARQKRNTSYGTTAAGFALGLIGAVGFVWSFTF